MTSITLAPPSITVASAPAPTPAASRRIIFVDLARAAAVLMMLQGHTLHVALSRQWEGHPLFEAWLVLRGLTSPTFLFLSGFAFSIATYRSWQKQGRWDVGARRRALRFAGFVALGYLLHFPVRGVANFTYLSAAGWRGFLQSDILQVIGLGLLLLQALVMLQRSAVRFAVGSGLLAAMVVTASPWLRAVDWSQRVSAWLAPYLYGGVGSYFPLFPWLAFLLVGASLGMLYAHFGARIAPLKLTLALLLMAAACGAVALLDAKFVLLGPAQTEMEGGLRFFTSRLAGALALLALFTLLGRRTTALPKPLQALAQESLVIYFLHLCLIYGSIWNPGLKQLLGGERLGLLPTLLIIALLWSLMIAVAMLWSAAKKRYPERARWGKLALLALLVVPLL